MKRRFLAARQWLLTIASAGSLAAGVFALQSCAGEGGPVGAGGGGGTDTSITRAFQALFPTAQTSATYVGNNTCSQESCHGGATSVHAEYLMTEHANVNVSCESCHGPGSVHAAAPATNNILGFDKVTASVVCGQCHGEVYEQWSFSKHSRLIDSPVVGATTNPASNGRSSRCVSCHGGLFRTKWQDRGIDIGTLTDQQIRDTADSILGSTENSSAIRNTATCVTCHDPHAKTGNLSDEGEEVQLRKKTFNLDTTPIDPESLASETTTYDHVCAQCHNGRASNNSDSRLNSSTSRPSMHDSNQMNMLLGIGGVEGSGPVVRNTAHANIPGQCTTCHMPDSKHNFVVQYDKGCAPCHTATDAAARVTAVKGEVIAGLYQLLSRLESYSQTTFGDPDLWNYTSLVAELGKTAPAQNLVDIRVKRARHNYYFVVRDNCFGPHNAPYALHLIRVANENLTSLGVPGGSAPTRNVSFDEKYRVIYKHFELVKRVSHTAIED